MGSEEEGYHQSPIPVNEYIYQCKVNRVIDGTRYETMPDIPLGSGFTNVSGRMTLKDSWNKRWAHTDGDVSKFFAKQPADSASV